MFGDSITEFAFEPERFSLGAALQNRYVRRLQILHRGFSGYTSIQAIHLAREILAVEHDSKPPKQQIKLAYVFFGTNDARLKGTSKDNNQHVPLEDYIKNMSHIIELFKKREIPLIVVLPGLHDQAMWESSRPGDLATGDYRNNDTNRKYGQALASKCDQLGVPYLDMLSIMETELQKGRSSEDLLLDGVHYTGLTYRLFYEKLVSIIDDRFPTLHNMAIPQQFPYRRDITFESLSDLK